MNHLDENREDIQRKDLVKLREQLLWRLARASQGIGALGRATWSSHEEEARRFQTKWLIPALSWVNDCYDLVCEALPSDE